MDVADASHTERAGSVEPFLTKPRDQNDVVVVGGLLIGVLVGGFLMDSNDNVEIH